jgi:DNA-binding NarL/FixJ family response regulator
MGEKIRIILADDHALVLEGLQALVAREPDIEVVALAEDGDRVLELLGQHQVDVVVMDLQMPYHGLSVLSEIRRRGLQVRVLVLTAFSDGESIQSALELEADGLALKTEPPSQTVEAIRQVAHGRLVFPRAARRWLAVHRGSQPTSPPTSTYPLDLTEREWEVLAHLAQGRTNQEIAETLSVSENTVRFHLKNIYEKLGVTNRTEAAAWYFQHGQTTS